MKVSIIVKADADDLLHLIPCLDGQEYSPYEILLLCNDRTWNWLISLNRPKKTIRRIEGDYNRAVYYSTGELIFILDGDAILEPEFISHWVAMYQTERDIYAIGPGVTMWNRYDYIDAGGDVERLKGQRIRVDNTNYITTRSILNVSGYL